MKIFHFFVVLLVLGCMPGAAIAAKTEVTQTPPILPQQFGGWQMQDSAHTSDDPVVADPTNGGVLKEYRFADLALATYTRDDGRTLKVRAARFADASGAFGAYTFYLQPNMTKEQIGDQGASLGNRVLFYRGDVLVDAQFSQETAMSGAELRELAGALPKPGGNNGNLPPFIQFLPRRGYIANTQKYVMGPVALNTMAPPISADLVDFGASAEVSFARYSTSSGEATLMLISYPTPQLAADHLRRIDAAHKVATPQAGESTIGGSGTFFDKRTGPIVAIATGGISDSDANSLLGMVNYEASVTWNTPSESGQVHDLYMLTLNIVILCGVLAGLAIVAGVAFGGIRILVKRMYPDRVFDRPEHMEFISLRLTETTVKGASENGPGKAR
ncbi:MAG TPA: DUF6599 family protein [Candidatus Sulfotelmatobacter sp.]|jgi:hypothetical protein|nr:DUF6599 family protein [Candidatus Sulfotelmatobacter sp.]